MPELDALHEAFTLNQALHLRHFAHCNTLRFGSTVAPTLGDIDVMRDRDIRPALKAEIRQRFDGVALFDELPLRRGQGRADIAAVNCSLWGFEIKSAHDTLNRLPDQVENYDAVFHFSTVVAAEKHLPLVQQVVPQHWGISVVSDDHERIHFEEIRQPQRNHNQCTLSLIKILWKQEAIRILREHDVTTSRRPLVKEVWSLLETIPRDKLDVSIVAALKARRRESVERQTQCDGLFPTEANR